MKLRHKFIVFVSAVVKKGDELLILKRSGNLSHHPNMWSIVSVSVRSGETPETAIRRGVFEEAGIIIQPERIFQTYNFFYEDDNNQEAVGFVYEVRYISGDIRLASEKNSEYRWIKPQEIYNYEFTGTVKENLLEVAGYLQNVSSKLRKNDFVKAKIEKNNILASLNMREKEVLNILISNVGKPVDIQTIAELSKYKVRGENPSYSLIYKTISTLRTEIDKLGLMIISTKGGYALHSTN